LLDFCRLLYEPVNRMVVILREPRYWQVQSLGKVSDSLHDCVYPVPEIRSNHYLLQGKLKFSETHKVRKKPMQKWQPPAPAGRTEQHQQTTSTAPGGPKAAIPVKLRLNLNKGGIGPNRQPSISLSTASPTPPPPPMAPPQRQASVSSQQQAQSPRVQTPVGGPGRITLKIPKRPSQGGPSS